MSDACLEREGILKARSYAAFRAALRAHDCRACELWRGRSGIVVDRGSAAARILLVGEAPGAEEDRLGMAFVGRSGKLLDEMLREAGIEPERDVLIANIVKCRPPGNRAPTPVEAAECLPFLQRQIALSRPLAIGLLGRTALRHLAGSPAGLPLGSIAGTWVEAPPLPGGRALALYHPAFILRDPRRRAEMVGHLGRLREGAP